MKDHQGRDITYWGGLQDAKPPRKTPRTSKIKPATRDALAAQFAAAADEIIRLKKKFRWQVLCVLALGIVVGSALTLALR